MLITLAVFLTIGALLIYKSDSSIDSKVQANSDNFSWNNNWNNNNLNINPEQINPENPALFSKQQFVANSYPEAMKMSGEKGMPVLIIFYEDLCQYCKMFKKQVLPDSEVKFMMMNYILLMVNTSDETGQKVASKYGLRYIPAFAITNSNERRLKFQERYMDVKEFVKWLNNPNMFEQPRMDRKLPHSEEEPERFQPEIQPERRRRGRRYQQPSYDGT